MRNRLTDDAPTLFVSQYGEKHVASSLKELREKCGGGKVSKMYRDKKDGRTMWTGYVIGPHWFTALKWREVDATTQDTQERAEMVRRITA